MKRDISKSISSKFQIRQFTPVEFFTSTTYKDIEAEGAELEEIKEQMIKELELDIKKQKDYFLKIYLNRVATKSNKTENDLKLEAHLTDLIDLPF